MTRSTCRRTAAQRSGANTVLPAAAQPLTLHTSDGLRLVGELAQPARPATGGHPRLPAPAADRTAA